MIEFIHVELSFYKQVCHFIKLFLDCFYFKDDVVDFLMIMKWQGLLFRYEMPDLLHELGGG